MYILRARLLKALDVTESGASRVSLEKGLSALDREMGQVDGCPRAWVMFMGLVMRLSRNSTTRHINPMNPKGTTRHTMISFLALFPAGERGGWARRAMEILLGALD